VLKANYLLSFCLCVSLVTAVCGDGAAGERGDWLYCAQEAKWRNKPTLIAQATSLQQTFGLQCEYTQGPVHAWLGTCCVVAKKIISILFLAQDRKLAIRREVSAEVNDLSKVFQCGNACWLTGRKTPIYLLAFLFEWLPRHSWHVHSPVFVHITCKHIDVQHPYSQVHSPSDVG